MKTKILVLVFMFILFILGCNRNDYEIKEQNNMVFDEYSIELIKNDSCTNNSIDYQNMENKVFMPCLDEVNLVMENGHKITLKKYFEEVNKTFQGSIDFFTSKMINTETLNNNYLYIKDDFSITICNTMNNKKDIYIGDSTIKTTTIYCK